MQDEKKIAENCRTQDAVAKYTIKDSVFTHLFQDRKYLFQLYQTIHPEDIETTEDELMDITIHNILTNDIYNDVGFLVGEKLLILVEAQSLWSDNIVVRTLMYLMVTYQEYIKKTKQNVFGSRKVRLPLPEMYVVYTGDRRSCPESISLAEEFFAGSRDFLDARVKVLYGSDDNDIISQYVTFTRVYDEQRKFHGRTCEAVLDTIRICKDRNVLKEYLENREKEVVAIMLAMYDEQEILRDYIESEKYEMAKEAAVQMLRDGGVSAEQIASYFSVLTVDDVKKLQEEILRNT